jgi:chaperonin GroES
MSLKLRPLADRVVVEPVEREETLPSGLVMPDTAKEKPQRGKVLAAGPGRLDEDGDRIAMEVAVGDQVLYAKYAGTEIKVDGKKVLIMKESDILAVVEA